MKSSFPNDERLKFLIGDVRDKERLLKAMRGIDIVIHAAALKRIEVGEYNPDEIIKTNIMGSLNVVECAITMNVHKCLLVSSDKAVEPANTYGATKMVAERLFTQAPYTYGDPETVFLVVRYGNVIGSNGSVIPFFKRLAAEGKKLPLTHCEMTRFLITLDDAIDLVNVTLKDGESGEIWIKKIHAVSLLRLAKQISQDIEITGIGPGEKKHECLVSRHELSRTFDYGDYFIVVPLMSNRETQESDALKEPFTSDLAYHLNDEEIRKLLE